MEENANKVHFKCTDFKSYMRVALYAECIYVLAKYLKYLAYYIFDYNSRTFWSVFISYVPLETGMNTS